VNDGRRSTSWDRAACALAWLLAAACLAGAALIPAADWAAWFTHPSFNAPPPTTQRGAALLRVMLLDAAVLLAAVPIMLMRLSPAAHAPSKAIDVRAAPYAGWIVAGLVLIGLLLRATRLGEGLWYDEIAAIVDFARHGTGPIVGNLFDPANHIAHTLATSWSITRFEPMLGLELAARLPALLASLGSIPAVYLLAREATGAPRTGLFAAAFIAVAPVSVLEGVEARGYSMMICGSALSTYLLVVGLKRGKAATWLAYSVIVALTTWTHFVGAFVPIGHAAVLAWLLIRPDSRRSAAAGALAMLLAAALTLTLYAPALPDLFALATKRGAFTARGDQPRLLGEEGYRVLLQLGGSWRAWYSAVGGLVLLAAGAAVAWRDRALRVPAAAAMLGLAIMLGTVLIAGSWMYARFTFFALPGAALLIAIAMDRSLTRRLLVLYVVGMAGVFAIDLARRPDKQPLREAMLLASEIARPGEAIVGVDLRHGVLRLYAPADSPLVLTRHDDPAFEDTLRTSSAAAVVVIYPHLLTPSRREFLEASDYALHVDLPGWADWGRGGVQVWRTAR
jgi:hypothetical protein